MQLAADSAYQGQTLGVAAPPTGRLLDTRWAHVPAETISAALRSRWTEHFTWRLERPGDRWLAGWKLRFLCSKFVLNIDFL